MSEIETVTSPTTRTHHCDYNNVAGVLDVKLKKRFRQNHLLITSNNNDNNNKKRTQPARRGSSSPSRMRSLAHEEFHNSQHIPRILSPTSSSSSYEMRCDEIMKRLHLSSPIRHIVHREIEHEKEAEAKLILPKINSSSLPSSPKK